MLARESFLKQSLHRGRLFSVLDKAWETIYSFERNPGQMQFPDLLRPRALHLLAGVLKNRGNRLLIFCMSSLAIHVKDMNISKLQIV